MNKDRQPFKKAINSYYIAKTLSQTQLRELHKTIHQRAPGEQRSIWSAVRLTGIMAATLLLLITVYITMQTPAVINAAYADIKKDDQINNGMQFSVRQWIEENHITAVPEKYRVEMSKFCHLQQYQTSHLRVAGAEQGKLHLFFQQGDHPLHWRNRSGKVDEMYWKLITVREDLTLIVMYTADMREQAVRHILEVMLPELSA